MDLFGFDRGLEAFVEFDIDLNSSAIATDPFLAIVSSPNFASVGDDRIFSNEISEANSIAFGETEITSDNLHIDVVTGLPVTAKLGPEPQDVDLHRDELTNINNAMASNIDIEETTVSNRPYFVENLQRDRAEFNDSISRSLSPHFSNPPNDPSFDDGSQFYLEAANVPPAWNLATGNGITVAVVDGSIEHRTFFDEANDLTDRFRLDISRNFDRVILEGDRLAPSSLFEDSTYAADPQPNFLEFPQLVHGTAVAGIIAAGGDNNTDITGIAPNASIAALPILDGQPNDLRIADSLSYLNDDIDVYNNSWGPRGLLELWPRATFALEAGSDRGRDGLGNVYLLATGNRGDYGDNTNNNSLLNSRHTIAVGAVDSNGIYPDRPDGFYSTPGASILVSAPSSDASPDEKLYPSDPGRSVTTLDLSGEFGRNPGNVLNEFGGTSASTAIVSGVVALMLETNPSLSDRGVRHILVETSDKFDEDGNFLPNGEWQENGAGYGFSHRYGFGVVNAEKAVRMATLWAEEGIDMAAKVTASASGELEDLEISNDGMSVIDTAVVADNFVVEQVEVVFSSDRDRRGDLQIELISPSGTVSRLAVPHDPAEITGREDNKTYDNWTLTSVAHWGELAAGEWQLRVTDASGNGIASEDLKDWQLQVYGAIAPPEPGAKMEEDAAFLGSSPLPEIRVLGTAGVDEAMAIARDREGNTYIAGRTSGSFANKNLNAIYDSFVVKLDDAGNVVWTQQIGSVGYDEANSIAIDETGTVFVSGWTDGNGRDRDSWVAVLDSGSGTVLDRENIGDDGSGNDIANGIAVTNDGIVYVVGSSDRDLDGEGPGTYRGDVDAWIARYVYDENAKTLSQTGLQQFGTSAWDEANAIAVDAEGNIYMAGETDGDLDLQGTGTHAGNTDAWIVRLDGATGSLSWLQQLGTIANDRATAIAVNAIGAVYVAGSTWGDLAGENAGSGDAWIARLDGPTGGRVWQRQTGSKSFDKLTGVAIAGTSVYATGVTFGEDAWAIEWNDAGEVVEGRSLGVAGKNGANAIAADNFGVTIAGGNGADIAIVRL